ncbi:hypothetical protein, partial [Morganella psychrotolerans]|uniref:hypothetical protein n=1 Tax=Morganella psychrotolerans TaxID=368603 RepID=UPI000AE6D5A2
YPRPYFRLYRSILAEIPAVAGRGEVNPYIHFLYAHDCFLCITLHPETVGLLEGDIHIVNIHW